MGEQKVQLLQNLVSVTLKLVKQYKTFHYYTIEHGICNWFKDSKEDEQKLPTEMEDCDSLQMTHHSLQTLQQDYASDGNRVKHMTQYRNHTFIVSIYNWDYIFTEDLPVSIDESIHSTTFGLCGQISEGSSLDSDDDLLFIRHESGSIGDGHSDDDNDDLTDGKGTLKWR